MRLQVYCGSLRFFDLAAVGFRDVCEGEHIEDDEDSDKETTIQVEKENSQVENCVYYFPEISVFTVFKSNK
jgi:hypothetical protein